MLRKHLLKNIVMLLLISAAFTCEKSNDVTQNNPPKILEMWVDPTSVAPGGLFTLHAVVQDPDEQKLQMQWSATDGTFEGPISDDTLTYLRAPRQNTDITIGFSVTDGEFTATKYATIKVLAIPNLSISTDSIVINITPENPEPIVPPIIIKNTGSGEIQYTISANQPWLLLDPRRGIIKDSAIVKLLMNYNNLPIIERSFLAQLFVSTDLGNTTIPVYVNLVPRLEISTAELNFGRDRVEMPLVLANTGKSYVKWTIRPKDAWITVDKVQGRIEPTEQETVMVHIVRSFFVSNDPYVSSLTVSDDLNGNNNVSIVAIPSPYLDVNPIEAVLETNQDTVKVKLKNSGNGTLEWKINTNLPRWLTAEPTQGSLAVMDSSWVVLRVDRCKELDGVHEWLLEFTCNGPNAIVNVKMLVEHLSYLSPGSLSFGTQLNQLILEITHRRTVHGATWSISSSVPWLTLSRTGGQVIYGKVDTVRITIDRFTMNNGPYQSYLKYTSQCHDLDVQVSANVEPFLATSLDSLVYVRWDTANIVINNTQGGKLTWSSSAVENWITINPPSGEVVQNQSVVVSVNRNVLSPGRTVGKITFENNANNKKDITIIAYKKVVEFPYGGNWSSRIRESNATRTFMNFVVGPKLVTSVRIYGRCGSPNKNLQDYQRGVVGMNEAEFYFNVSPYDIYALFYTRDRVIMQTNVCGGGQTGLVYGTWAGK